MTSGLFFDGHLHWINVNGRCELFAFELDKETFSLFPSPPPVYEYQEEKINHSTLGVLKGCLSQYCWYPSFQFSVWVMKEYRIKNSWYKAFTIKETNIAPQLAYPLCLIDGINGTTSNLIAVHENENKFLVHCLDSNTYVQTNALPIYTTSKLIHYHPRFLKLQKFGADRVHPFKKVP